jgi:hypothetical protein
MAAYEGPDALPHEDLPLARALPYWAKDRAKGWSEADRANALVMWITDRCTD